MKIIQIMPEFGSAGAEIMCENLCYELKNAGNEVVVVSLFTLHTDITKRLENAKIKIIYLDKKKGFDWKILFRLRKAIKKEKADIIHTHRYILPYVFLATLGIRVKIVHTVHNVAQKECGSSLRRINNIIYHVGHVIPVALSQIVKDSISKEYNIVGGKIPVILNGINLKKCVPKDTYEICTPIKVLHVGRFAEQKNHVGLIDAFELFHMGYQESLLYLIGDGPELNKLQQIVRQKDLQDSIIFVGLTDNVLEYMHNSDVFVLSSLYEGIPMTIIEAMGTGLPIVSTNVGGIPDMIVDKEEGLLVDLNPQSIAAALKKIIDDKLFREKIGRNAIIKSKEFSSEIMAKKYLNIYKN